MEKNMKVSAFTFIKNGVILGYPFIESIKSALPLVDEFIVNVGDCDDNTLELILEINNPKIRIIQSIWNEKMRDRGYVYGQQKMIAQFNCSGDWAIYIEGDEIFHENEIENIRSNMKKYLNTPQVEALYFDFFHFYGDSDHLGVTGYRRAPRIIKNSIRSYAPDGLFWVVMDKNKKGRYPMAKHAGANVYHYGHVRSISNMQEKVEQVSKYWNSKPPKFKGYGDIDPKSLRIFNGSHPEIMNGWLENSAERDFIPNPGYKLTRRDKRNRIRLKIEDKFNIEISKKHYTEAKI
jgi:glycosyltransferase involved in cell wall biosynthesis